MGEPAREIPETPSEHFRALRASSGGVLYRGIPAGSGNFREDSYKFGGLAYIIGVVVGFVKGYSLSSFLYGLIWAFYGAILSYFFPLIVLSFRSIKNKTLLVSEFLRHGSLKLFFFVFVTAQTLSELIFVVILETKQPFTTRPDFWLSVLAAIAFPIYLNFRARKGDVPREKPLPKLTAIPKDLPFSLYLGRSTGAFAALSHGAGIAPSQPVTLGLTDAAQNILIFGGIGSGKTTRAVQPLLSQLLDQDAGGLIFDIKGDFKHAVLSLAGDCEREISVIGPKESCMNLLSGLTPEVASSFLKSAFLLNSKSGKHDPFWVDTATELCKNALGVLSFLPGKYSLSDLHSYLYDNAVREELNAEALKILMELKSGDRQARLLKSYQSYQETIFSAFDEKVKSGVNATVAQVLAPFNHPDLVDAFCTDNADAPSMDEVLNGKIYLVDMPLSIWGLGGKVAYNFIKLRFFNVMQRRNVEAEWDQARPVFFMCDEFQEIVSANRDGLSDLNFWDKSRSSKCIGIISAQAVSSFYAAIGNRDLADALLQNFRQKLCFRTEDKETIEQLNHLMGRVEVERTTYSTGDVPSSGPYGIPMRATTSGESTSVVEKQVLNPQIFRRLGPNEAVALLSIDGIAMDDVLEAVPVYVN